MVAIEFFKRLEPCLLISFQIFWSAKPLSSAPNFLKVKRNNKYYGNYKKPNFQY